MQSIRRVLSFPARAIVLAALVALVSLQTANPAPARGQEPARPVQTLAPYLLPSSAIPAGFRQTDVSELTNVFVAAARADPEQVGLLVERKRVTGAEQTLRRDLGQGRSITLTVDLSLFIDAAGAQADLTDFAAPPTVEVTQLTAPAIGDRAAAVQARFPFAAAPQPEGVGVGFTRGRLQVMIESFGPAGATTAESLIPLLQVISDRIDARPVPPPSAAESALLDAQLLPSSILYDSFRFLLAIYHSPVEPGALLTAAFAGAAGSLNRPDSAPAITESDPDAAWEQFLPAYQTLERATTDARSLAWTAADSMYASLNDCHNHFFKPSEYARVYSASVSSTASFVGVGVQVAPNSRPATIRYVYPGSPAERGGLRAGDQIVAVGDVVTETLAPDAVSPLIRGDEGTSVTLTVRRAGTDVPLVVTLVRASVQIPLEQHRDLGDGVGYLRFDNFTLGTEVVTRVQAALEDLVAQGDTRGLVLDLRYNSGGSAGSGTRIAGLFLGSGVPMIVGTTRAGTAVNYASDGEALPVQPPMVVLTSSNTASMGEIVAATLRQTGRARVVGETTAGCVNGGVSPQAFLDRSGAEIARVRTLVGPDQVAQENNGLVPDLSVPPSDDPSSGVDPQLDAALRLLAEPAMVGVLR